MTCPHNCPGEAGLPDWVGDEVDLTGRTFISVGVWHLFFIPLGMKRVFTRVMAQVEAAGLELPEGGLWLHRCGLFRGRLFMEVAPGDRSDLETLPGTYRTAVHRGSWSKIGSTIRELKARTTYLWYLTCPECSSAENHITVVLGR